MQKTERLRLGMSAALAMAVALAGCVSAPVTSTGASSEAAIAQEQAVLAGQARFPEALAAGGQVLPTGIGSVIQAAPARYRVSHAGHDDPEPAARDVPVAGALVVLRDPVTQALLPGQPPLRTDAEGRYRMSAPAGANHLVEVLFRLAPEGPVYHMMTLARVGDAAPADVTWATSAAITALLKAPPSDLRQYPLAQLHAEAAARQSQAQALPPEEQKPMLAAILAAPAEALGPGGVVGTLLPVPLPTPGSSSPSPSPSASPAPSVPGAAASLLPEVVEPVASTLPRATESVTGTVNETVEETAEETAEETEEVVDEVEETVEDVVGKTLGGLF